MPLNKRQNLCAESAQLERIISKLPSALQEAEKRVPQMLTDYQQRRTSLGKLLYQIQTKLAPLNLYSSYLKARNIPRRTAYDLVEAYLAKPAGRPQTKRKPTTYSPEEHRAERYSMLINQLGAYLDKQEDKHTALEKLCSASLGYPVTLNREKEVGA
jgi:hypothetical protein